MSWLSKGIKGLGKAVGGIAKIAAPIVGAIPGVGTLGGAALGGLGSVLSGGNMQSHLKSAAGGALGGILPGVAGKVMGGLGLGSGGGDPGYSQAIPDEALGIEPNGSAMGGLGDFITGNDGRNALGLAQAGFGAYNAYRGQQEMNRAMKAAQRRDEALAPIRDSALREIQNNRAPDMSALDRIRKTGNVYAQ